MLEKVEHYVASCARPLSAREAKAEQSNRGEAAITGEGATCARLRYNIVRAFVLINPRSRGLARAPAGPVSARIADTFKIHAVVATMSLVAGREIDVALRRAAASRNAEGERQFDIVVVGGGDGTVSAAASVLAGSDLPLGILPLGTFNHFARDLGIPLGLDAAIEAIVRNHVASVDVGEVNGHVFVNNSSLGIYPHLVAERDRHRRYGFARWMAAALACCRVLWRLPQPQVRAFASGWTSERRTPCVFIGNNMYELDMFAIAKRSRLDQGKLCLYIANPQGRLALMRLAVRAFLGRLKPEADFTPACLETVEIWADRHRLRVALDGEAMVFRSPLHYRIRPRALRIIIPEVATL